MKSLRKAPAVLALAGLSQLTCHQVILTAPQGSTMECFVNPEFIMANGDVAVVSALVIDGTGSPVADGTVVQFFTNLGRIPEQGKTNDGVVRVNFTSDSRSGQASIRVISGGEGGGGGGGGGGGTTTTTIRTAPPGEAAAFAGGAVATASGVLASCPPLTVDIGNALPTAVIVTANPQRLTGGARTSEVTAFVRDEFGNPVAGVPVIFESDNARLGEMDSRGFPRYTNNDGYATDVFRTRLGPNDGPAQALVIVRVPRVAPVEFPIFIN